MGRPNLYDVNEEDLKAWFNLHQYPAFRFKQLCSWLKKGIVDVEEMSNLPNQLKHHLSQEFEITPLQLMETYPSHIDDTIKFVSKLSDANIIETVFMRYKTGTSVCVSSQAGCLMGCNFCASTGVGFGRNLTVAELLGQVFLAEKLSQSRIDHVTVMGIGEPLENLDHLLSFIYKLNDREDRSIGLRKITVSTCGLVEKMKVLANVRLPITLAVSLHAPNDAIRKQIMPIANRYEYDTLMRACISYQKATNRRMTYEYAMFEGINDQEVHARELAKRLKKQLCHVNLIPVNEIPNGIYKRPSKQQIKLFSDILESEHIPCTIRRELGSDINAACGQLRSKQDANK